jgi:two-component system chemotaxis response regulator CheB
MPPIKVMIVDDSAVVRQVLSATLGEDHAIEVIGTAVDPVFALERMKTCWPDVIVLDVEMPRMDGITFLRKIMAEHPTPVVICSTLTEKGRRQRCRPFRQVRSASLPSPRWVSSNS